MMLKLCLHLVSILVVVSTTIAAPTATTLTLTGDRLSGVVLPVLPRASDIQLDALKAESWTVDDTKRLILNENISISIGAFTFDADQAVVWINRLPTDAGLVSQIAVYLPTFAKSSSHSKINADGKNLLILGSTLGSVSLDVALMEQQRPRSSNTLVKTAESRLAAYLKELVLDPPSISSRPVVYEDFPELESGEAASTELMMDKPKPWFQRQSGFMSFAADLVELQTNDVENAVTLIGNVLLSTQSNVPSENIELSAAKGVVFLNAGSIRDMASGAINLSEIHGVYLEGNVVIQSGGGEYLLRAPQVYYDFTTGKAVMLEAVLRTYIKDGRVPLYIRAEELRQISEHQWVGDGVQASTSSFVTPDLAIGASRMEITQGDDGNTYIKSEDNVLRLGGTPIAYWPRYKGVAGEIPLRRVKYGYKKDYGSIIETSWNVDTLLGRDSQNGIDSVLHVDGYTNRGMGVGLDFAYQMGRNKGTFDVYFLSDSGTEQTSSGITIDVTTNERGYALFKNSTSLSEHWTVNSQLSYISDETYISVWRPTEFRTNPEFETSLYAKYQKDNAAFTALAKYDLNQFISTSWLLASRQYKVDKAPELGYFRYGDDLFEGAVNWSSEFRLLRERLVFQPGTPNGLGLRNTAFAFPDGTILGGNQLISAPLVTDGLQTEFRNRFVTRQDFTIPLEVGAVKIVPFATIQAQWGIDNDPTVFTGELDTSIWSAGVRAFTQFQRVFNDVDNSMLDLHRLRHVVEPYLTIWTSESSEDISQTQQYDSSIDNLSTGTAIWFGMRNRLQTWRGGPGRWYQVDWITLDTAFIFADDDTTQRYDNPQFFNWRPEYSSIRDAFIARGKWRYSDSLSFVGNGTWELDGGTFSRGMFGVELDHGRDMTTYLEYREIGNTNDQYLTLGLRYQLNKRYSMNITPSWNFDLDDFQTFHFGLTRHYPDFDLMTHVNYNEILGDTQFGFRLNFKKF